MECINTLPNKILLSVEILVKRGNFTKDLLALQFYYFTELSPLIICVTVTDDNDNVETELSEPAPTAPNLLDVPPQNIPPADFKFPKRRFGSTAVRERACLHEWFMKYKWLSYISERDVVVCYTCYVTELKSKN